MLGVLRGDVNRNQEGVEGDTVRKAKGKRKKERQADRQTVRILINKCKPPKQTPCFTIEQAKHKIEQSSPILQIEIRTRTTSHMHVSIMQAAQTERHTGQSTATHRPTGKGESSDSRARVNLRVRSLVLGPTFDRSTYRTHSQSPAHNHHTAYLLPLRSGLHVRSELPYSSLRPGPRWTRDIN